MCGCLAYVYTQWNGLLRSAALEAVRVEMAETLAVAERHRAAASEVLAVAMTDTKEPLAVAAIVSDTLPESTLSALTVRP